MSIPQPRGRIALTGGPVILVDRIANSQVVAPGLIDIHTHGAYGHTFNEPTAAAFAAITAANAA